MSKKMNNLNAAIFALLCCLAFSLIACMGVKSIQMSDLSESEFSDALSINRSSIGLPPLPTSGNGQVFYLNRSSAKDYHYDVRIELLENPNSTRISREIIFKKEPSGYKYIGEKVISYGPGYFGDKENQFQENLKIKYSTQNTWEDNFIGYKISYSGNDRHLKSVEIGTQEALKIIAEWNNAQ